MRYNRDDETLRNLVMKTLADQEISPQLIEIQRVEEYDPADLEKIVEDEFMDSIVADRSRD